MDDPRARNSTTVRSRPTPVALRVAGRSLRALAAVSPESAAALTERLFLSPPRFAPPSHERAAFAAARPARIDGPDGPLRLWRFDAGAIDVLLLHGWGGRASQMAAFVAPMRAAGLRVAALDGPAHGDSAGRLATVPGFAVALRQAHCQLGFRAVVGHSMGGAATAVAVARHQLPLEAAVLIGSPARPSRFVRDFADALGLPAPLEAVLLRRLKRRTGLTLSEIDAEALAPALRGAALVIHDRADREVPYADAEALVRAWPGAELLTTAGLGHRRILRDRHVAAAAARFVAAALGRPLRPCLTEGCPDVPLRPGAHCERCALEAFLFDPGARGPFAA
jgi:pimeloyl-ACP methyl ester carboxylesterase